MRDLKLKVRLAVLSLAFVLTGGAFADGGYDWVNVPGSFVRLDPGRVIDLPVEGGWRHVKTLTVKADATNGTNGNFEVIVNGEVKGSASVPWKNEYVITIGETTNNIRLRHLNGGSINFLNIKSLQSCRPVEDFNPGFVNNIPNNATSNAAQSPAPLPQVQPGKEAAVLARKAIRLVDALRDYVDPTSEYPNYLLPIKTVAGRAFAVAASQGDLSRKTQDALEALAKQIVFAEPCINSLFKKNVTFELAIELVALKNDIEDCLD